MKKFTVTVDDDLQKDLISRLKNTRYFKPIDDGNIINNNLFQ